MSKGEYTNIILNAKQTNKEYLITDGIIEPNGFIPDHFHKWEDQTFHIVEGKLEAKIGEHWYELNVGVIISALVFAWESAKRIRKENILTIMV